MDVRAFQPTRRQLLLFLALVAVLAGVRFSDGSMMLAIARGATLADGVFRDPATQYVWDSPLKVALLRALPASVGVIAAVFLLLALAPAAVALGARAGALSCAFVALAATPAWKLSLQNVGLGDGLVVGCALAAHLARRPAVAAAAYAVIGLWHPQQAFFMGVSFFVGAWVFASAADARKAKALAVALAGAAVVYLAYRAQLGFDYSGRAAYMALRGRELLPRNLLLAPLAFLPLALWFAVYRPTGARGRVLLVAWLLVLAAVALATTDVTRVMTITSLPLVLIAASADQGRRLTPRAAWWLALTVLAVPPVAWSGLDISVWPDLLADACRWKGWCW